MEKTIVQRGFKKYIKVEDNQPNDEVEVCKKCCFHIVEENGEVVCNSPCDARFWGCGDGSFHWEKK